MRAWVSGKLSPPGRPQGPDRFGSSWGSDLCHSIGTALSLQSRGEGSRSLARARPGYSHPRPPWGDPVCASDFTPHSSLLWPRIFVSRGPLGAVGSGEGQCGNLSPAGKGGRPLPFRQFGVVLEARNAAEGWSWFCQNMRVPHPAGTCQHLLSPHLPAGMPLNSGCFCALHPSLLVSLKDPGYKPEPPLQERPQELAGEGLSRRSPPLLPFAARRMLKQAGLLRGLIGSGNLQKLVLGWVRGFLVWGRWGLSSPDTVFWGRWERIFVQELPVVGSGSFTIPLRQD